MSAACRLACRVGLIARLRFSPILAGFSTKMATTLFRYFVVKELGGRGRGRVRWWQAGSGGTQGSRLGAIWTAPAGCRLAWLVAGPASPVSSLLLGHERESSGASR